MKTDFKSITGFKNYEANSDGQIRNAETKKAVAFSGTSYQLKADDGLRRRLTVEKVKELHASEKPAFVSREAGSKARADKKAGKAGKKPGKVAKPKTKAEGKQHTGDHADILNMKAKNHEKAYRLSKKGLSVEDIHKLTNRPKPAISRDIWFYTSGRKQLKK